VFEGPLLTAFISFLLNDRSVRVASAATAANALHKVAAFMATEVLDVAESAAAQAYVARARELHTQLLGWSARAPQRKPTLEGLTAAGKCAPPAVRAHAAAARRAAPAALVHAAAARRARPDVAAIRRAARRQVQIA
jgi:hypothetical protein